MKARIGRRERRMLIKRRGKSREGKERKSI